MSEADTRTATGGPAPAGLRALVVDDEPPLVKVVSTYLEREGFEVATAGDGERAVELAREFAPDVIVLDLMLPNSDGPTVWTGHPSGRWRFLQLRCRIGAISRVNVTSMTAVNAPT